MKQTGIYDIKVTDNTMSMKSKLYLRIILSISYMMKENLYISVELSPVKHATSRFSVGKKVTKKTQKRQKDQVRLLPVFYPEAPRTTLC